MQTTVIKINTPHDELTKIPYSPFYTILNIERQTPAVYCIEKMKELNKRPSFHYITVQHPDLKLKLRYKNLEHFLSHIQELIDDNLDTEEVIEFKKEKDTKSKLIEQIEDDDWNVFVSHQRNYSNPEKYDTIWELSKFNSYGHDYNFGIWAETAKEFIEKLHEYIANYDVDEEASIYVDKRGKNGIPDKIIDIYKSAEEDLENTKNLYTILTAASCTNNNTITTENTHIVSNRCIYSDEYIFRITGKKPMNSPSLAEVEKMKLDYWNYPLTEINHIIENDLSVILVKFPDDKGEFEYRLCEVPLTVEKDPFYSEENQTRLKESIAQAESGKIHTHNLIEN